jgi:hypothetical protein
MDPASQRVNLITDPIRCGKQIKQRLIFRTQEINRQGIYWINQSFIQTLSCPKHLQKGTFVFSNKLLRTKKKLKMFSVGGKSTINH